MTLFLNHISTYYNLAQKSPSPLPTPSELPGTNEVVPYVFLGDSAFALNKNFIKPFTFKNISEKQRIFNYRLSRARRVVENALGILASRFKVLQRPLNLDLDSVDTIVLACCTLYNYLRKHELTYIPPNYVDRENITKGTFSKEDWRKRTNELVPLHHSINYQRNVDANGTRNKFVDYFNGEGRSRDTKTNRIFIGMATNLLKHVYFILRTYFEAFIDYVFAMYWETERKVTIPALEERQNILANSAVDLAAKIRNRELKSEDLVRSCIERIKLVNPVINAVTDERYDEALKEAQEVDKLIERGLSKEYFEEKPFLGVPFTTKESHMVTGLRQTLGILSRRHTKSSEDAEAVRLLRKAGAIPVAVTNVPEINKWQESRNNVYGQTNNPYHAGRTPGGSSGGEAALCAAIATPISLCSDIGGSTRMPAFFCGLYGYICTAGHTNSRGLAFRDGKDPTMATISFVSRHFSDLIPLTKIVTAEKGKALDLDSQVDAKRLRIFYMESSEDVRVSPICSDLRHAMKRVINKLTEAASSTEYVPKQYKHEGFNYMYSLWRHRMTYETETFSKCLANNNGEVNGLVELGKKLVGMSEFTLAAILKCVDDQVLPKTNEEWAEETLKSLSDDLARQLGSDGVLLLPSAPAPAPYHYTLFTRPFNFAYWAVVNALGLPAVQIPLGLNADGIPLGIQVVAARRRDPACLAAAQYIAQLCGGISPPCQILQ